MPSHPETKVNATSWLQRSQSKIIAPEDLANKIAELRSAGKSIGTINGSFDLMHAGHLHILYEAAQQADVLIVALNSDRSIQQYKNSDRPIIPLKYRLQMMAALEFACYVTWFDETDPRNVLSIIKPDVHTNGAEYGDTCIEADTVRQCGGRLHLVERIDSLSTSEILKKVQTLIT